MDEYRINGLTIKENLLQLAENENKKFTESLHPGIENVLGIRIPALRRLGAQIAKDDWESYLQTADTYYMEGIGKETYEEYGEDRAKELFLVQKALDWVVDHADVTYISET